MYLIFNYRDKLITEVPLEDVDQVTYVAEDRIKLITITIEDNVEKETLKESTVELRLQHM